MQCDSCKYFAVPLTSEEKAIAHCPGANPDGELEKKICTLKGKPDFSIDKMVPPHCVYYFPRALRFR